MEDPPPFEEHFKPWAEVKNKERQKTKSPTAFREDIEENLLYSWTSMSPRGWAIRIIKPILMTRRDSQNTGSPRHGAYYFEEHSSD